MADTASRPISRRTRGHIAALAVSAVLAAAGVLVTLLASTQAALLAGVIILLAAWGAVVGALVLLPGLGYRAVARGIRQRDDRLRAELRQRDKAHTIRLERVAQQQRRSEARVDQTLNAIRQIAGLTLEAAADEAIDVLFVTSNGAGLGHLSRLMAIAREMPEGTRVEFLTLSKAYRQAATVGFPVHYFPSADASGQETSTWNVAFREHVGGLLALRRPRLVVFDGTWVYGGLTQACEIFDVPILWVQRGMWLPEVDARSPQRHDVASVASAVIIPGDYAGPEQVNVGPGIDPVYVPPIVMTKPGHLLTRKEACFRLDLDPNRRYALVSLGKSTASAVLAAREAALQKLTAEGSPFVPVVLESPLADVMDPHPGVVRRTAYPIMPLIRAFDVMIAAAGYNSSQEAVALEVPTILVPNGESRTDDQPRRAREMAQRGLVLTAETPDQMRECLAAIVQEQVREGLVRACRSEVPADGAVPAAQAIARILSEGSWTDRAVSIIPGEERDGKQ